MTTQLAEGPVSQARQITDATVNRWGNGLAVRINKALAKAAGVEEGTPIRVVAEPGRIVIETVKKKYTLSEMLKAFDPKLHGGELMVTHGSVGKEVLE